MDDFYGCDTGCPPAQHSRLQQRVTPCGYTREAKPPVGHTSTRSSRRTKRRDGASTLRPRPRRRSWEGRRPPRLLHPHPRKAASHSTPHSTSPRRRLSASLRLGGDQIKLSYFRWLIRVACPLWRSWSLSQVHLCHDIGSRSSSDSGSYSTKSSLSLRITPIPPRN